MVPTLLLLISQFILYVTNSQSIFNATLTGQFQNQNITCDDSQACTIIGDTHNACRESTITCPTNYQCDIKCNALHSCREITINPPQDESLFNWQFTGEHPISFSTYPIFINNTKDFTLDCIGTFICSSVNVICPSHAKCTINCNGTSACYFVCLNCVHTLTALDC